MLRLASLLQAFFSLASVAAFAHLGLLLRTGAISLARPSTLSLMAFLLPVVALASVALSHYVHLHTCRSSDLVLIGWSALSVLAIPYLRTTIREGALTTPAGNAIWSTFASAVIFGAVGLGIELLGPRWTWRGEGKIKLEDGARPERGGSDNPFLTANFFERLTFSWLTPLMKLGSKRYIDEDDVFSRASLLVALRASLDILLSPSRRLQSTRRTRLPTCTSSSRSTTPRARARLIPRTSSRRSLSRSQRPMVDRTRRRPSSSCQTT